MTIRRDEVEGRVLRALREKLPGGEWMRKEVPALRIVPDDLWSAAKSRQQQARHTMKTAGALGAAKRPRHLQQDLFEEFCDEFTREMNRLRMERRAIISSAKR